MADSTTNDKVTEEQKSKEYTITLKTPDGSSEITVILEENEDATQPPRLVKISKNSLDSTPSQSTSTPEARETHIILSTGSGHQKAVSFYEDILTPVLNTIYGSETVSQAFHLHTTQSATSILALVHLSLFAKANSGTPLRIILASGDGGIIDLVNGLSSHPTSDTYIAPQIVLLPLGTANALYHSTHSTSASPKNTWGLHALTSPTSKPLPTFTATFSPGSRLLVDEARTEEVLPTDSSGNSVLYGAVVASWGMHASLVADSDTAAYRKFGIDRFKLATKENLFPADGSAPHAYAARVSLLQNGTWTDLPAHAHMYVLATLVSNLEAAFCISPATKPLDGSLHVVQFGPTTGEDAMRIMGLAYQGGKHVGDGAVRYEKAEGMRVAFEGREEEGRWRRVCVDGKIVRVDGEGWVEVRLGGRPVLEVVV
ncbi:hypothetical protein IQ07DRAFT_654133 [Pyrenochaeta sp. DS3sAY3a]|nr:hypothetical protein IQ07DRAFT_654133 [Pyrenochaeta sp. DS3sAY3a]